MATTRKAGSRSPATARKAAAPTAPARSAPAPKTKREELSPTQQYGMWLVTCADTPDQLRRCDLQRALDEAENGGDLVGFARWLMGERPDMMVDIAKALTAMAERDTAEAAEVEEAEPAAAEPEPPVPEATAGGIDETRWPASLSFRDDRWREDPRFAPVKRLTAWIAAAFPRHALRLAPSVVPDRNLCVIEAAMETDDNRAPAWRNIVFVRSNPRLAMPHSVAVSDDQDITSPAGLTKTLRAISIHLNAEMAALPDPENWHEPTSVTAEPDGAVTVRGTGPAAMATAAAIADGAPVPPAGMSPGQKAAWTRRYGKGAPAPAPAPAARVEAPAPVTPETMAVIDFPDGVSPETIWQAIERVTGSRERAWVKLTGEEKRAVLALLKGKEPPPAAPPAPEPEPAAPPAAAAPAPARTPMVSGSHPIAAMVSAGPGYIVQAEGDGYLPLAARPGGWDILVPDGAPRSIAACLHYIGNDLRARTKAQKAAAAPGASEPVEEVRVSSPAAQRAPAAPAPAVRPAPAAPKPGSAPVPTSARDTMPPGLTAGQKAAWTRRMKALSGAAAH